MMRLYALALLPALTSAFVAPSHHRVAPSHGIRVPTLYMTNEVEDLAANITDKTEEVLEKIDTNIITRGIRLLNHVPIVFTLRHFGNAVSSAKFGIDAAPTAFAGAVSNPALLALPNYIYYAWPLIAICQLAEVSVSALAGDDPELSQSDITTLAVSNVCAAKALAGGTNALAWLAATGVLSARPLRVTGEADSNLRTAAFELLSSFATVTSLLAVTARVSTMLPTFKFQGEVVASAALFLYYAIVNREGNGLIKRIVNFGAIAGITASRILQIGGLSRDLLSASLFGAAYLTYLAGKKVADKLE